MQDIQVPKNQMSPDFKEAARQMVQFRTQEIVEEVFSAVSQALPVVEPTADSLAREAELFELIQMKVGTAYHLGAKDASVPLFFLIAQ